MRKFVLAIALTIGIAAPATAQVWDSPFMVAPRPPAGLGLYLVDVAGGDVGFMARWQPTSTSWAIRGGIADSYDDVALFGGVDISGALTRSRYEFPLDIDWVFGVGATIVPDFIISVPLGLTVGHTFTGDGTRFTPYLTPRIIMDAFFEGPKDGLDLDFAADLGVDVRFQPGWAVRFGATLGDREALGIGVVIF